MKVGNILVKKGILKQEDIDYAKEVAVDRGISFKNALLQENMIDESQYLSAQAEEYGVEFVDLSTYPINQEACKYLSEKMVRKHHLIPIDINLSNKSLIVAMENPFDILAIDDAKISSGMNIKVTLASKKEIMNAIKNNYTSSEDVEKAIAEYNESDVSVDVFQEFESADVSNAPVVRLVKSIISDAVKSGTSDIHIEPFEDRVRVRNRIDGDLKEVLTLEKSVSSAMITRIKIIGRMDISEKRIPQDGRVETVVDDRPVDMRISILPTVYGEKAVIRLLDRGGLVVGKEQLGFTPKNLELFEKIIKAPEGMILLTGPTGSGKTTTLYAVLKELNNIKKNIITLEDPVEYRLDGVNQVQMNAKAGMTFASGLRSVLRQDPDVVMLGEIRDEETAQIAVRAAITGHVVLSTLHTNDTVSTISRLVDMGIESYMVTSAVVGVVAQRLIKKICPKCKEYYIPSMEEMILLGMEKPDYLCRGKGCNFCGGTGYSGRTAIHEILVIDKEVRTMVNRGEEADKIKNTARAKGMMTLSESAKQLVISGATTVEQMIRVAYSVDE